MGDDDCRTAIATGRLCLNKAAEEKEKEEEEEEEEEE